MQTKQVLILVTFLLFGNLKCEEFVLYLFKLLWYIIIGGNFKTELGKIMLYQVLINGNLDVPRYDAGYFS
jgi:hypothetical protein